MASKVSSKKPIVEVVLEVLRPDGTVMQIQLTDTERDLVDALVTAHLTNLVGHRAAIDEIPELAHVADQGFNHIDPQITVARQLLGKVRA